MELIAVLHNDEINSKGKIQSKTKKIALDRTFTSLCGGELFLMIRDAEIAHTQTYSTVELFTSHVENSHFSPQILWQNEIAEGNLIILTSPLDAHSVFLANGNLVAIWRCHVNSNIISSHKTLYKFTKQPGNASKSVQFPAISFWKYLRIHNPTNQ